MADLGPMFTEKFALRLEVRDWPRELTTRPSLLTFCRRPFNLGRTGFWIKLTRSKAQGPPPQATKVAPRVTPSARTSERDLLSRTANRRQPRRVWAKPGHKPLPLSSLSSLHSHIYCVYLFQSLRICSVFRRYHIPFTDNIDFSFI